MNRPTCARPLAVPSGANTSVKSRRLRAMKKNLSISLPCFSCPANRKRLPCPNFHQQMRCSRVDNVLPVPGVKPLLPPSDVLVGIHSNATVILATFPPEKDHGATLSRNRTSHVPNDILETHLPRLWDDPHHGATSPNRCRFTVSS